MEDDANLNQTLTYRLEREGYDVDSCLDGLSFYDITYQETTNELSARKDVAPCPKKKAVFLPYLCEAADRY